MAEVDVNITVEDSGVRGILEALQQKLRPNSLKEFLTTHAHEELKLRAEQRFSTEGDEVVGAWAQLAFMTGRIRSYQGYSPFHPINVRTGQLKNFVINTFTVKQLGGGALLTMPGDSSGTLFEKFRVAQQGGMSQGSKIGPNRPAPARPVLAMSEVDATVIGHSLLDWIRQGIF